MGLIDRINGGITMPNCNDCENYKEKEVKEKYEDSFTIYGKKDVKNEMIGIKILWYSFDQDSYEICYKTKTKQKTILSGEEKCS